MDFENQVTPPEEEALQATQPEEIPTVEAPVEETPMEETPVEETPAAEVPAEAAEQDCAQPDDSHFDLDMPQEKPKKKTGLILGVVAAVAAVSLTVGLIFGLGGKKEEDPHTAMINAQRDALYAAVDAFGTGMDNIDATAENAGSCAYVDFHVLLSESILDRLELILSQYGMELDLSFLQDIGISCVMNQQDLVTQYLIGLGLGDKEITYLDLIMDMDQGAMYLGLPELNPNYATTEFVSASELETGLQFNFQNGFNKLAENMPSREAMQSCLRSYVDLMLEQLKEPTVGEESVTVGEVTHPMTTVTYRLTEAQLLEFAKAALEKLKADETAKQFIKAYVDYMNTALEGTNGTAEGDMDDYVAALQEAITQLDTRIAEAKAGNYIDLTGYLDAKQNLRGYKLVVNTEGEDSFSPLHWITLEDGDKELVEIVLYSEADQEFLSVTGTQKTVDGLYNGSFKLTFPERRSLTVELIDMTMDPFLNGSIQLTPNTNLLKEIVGDSYTTLRILGANLGLRIDIAGGADSGSFGFHFTADGSSLVGITMDAAYKASDPITLPDESKLLTGADAFAQLGAGLDLTKLPEKLEAAGVPAELADMLELFLFMPEDAA